METGEATTLVKRQAPAATPKSIINQRYGNKACYKTEQVQESAQNGCPGLSIPQQGRFLFRCCLQLPEFSITSELCTRKKDAEQAAAKIAIEKLGIQSTASTPSLQEAHDQLIARISYIFSNEVVRLSLSKLTEIVANGSYVCLELWMRAALKREGDLRGMIPVAILLACDSKLSNLCKCINLKAESNILLSVSLILRAARLSSSVATSEENLWIWSQHLYSPDSLELSVNEKSILTEDTLVEAIRIPCSNEKPVEPLVLNISSKGYYMDAIAQELGVADTSCVLVSRPVGRASSETRFYFSASQFPFLLGSPSDLLNSEETFKPEAVLNSRACYLSGQNIYGDAILSTIGFTWKSTELFHENLSLSSYYRMLVGRQPDGGYKISREALLAAELPVAFTTRSNWRGSLPRDLLCAFCRQNWLSEPEFSSACIENSTESLPETHKMVSNSAKESKHADGGIGDNGKSVGMGGSFRCDVKILSKNCDLIIECSPKDLYRKQNDAIQNSALKVLSWLNKYLKNQDISGDNFPSYEDIRVYPQRMFQELQLYITVHTDKQTNTLQGCKLLGPDCEDQLRKKQRHNENCLNIEGPDSSFSSSNGSLACIKYSVSLVKEGEHSKELLESHDEFEFEIGTSAVIPLLESCVTQLSVGQSDCFITAIPYQHLILAAATNCANPLLLLSLQGYHLEYSVNLLRVMEPLEDRMEQALFSPPLSKQRVEYAWRHINESHATTLVDFGCGSGSLLDSLLDHPTSLEKIVGVDISRKSLIRAAKVLHSKLGANSAPTTSIKSALLYDGSITEFDSRLYGFDIGTCLEVIEHMEEEQACLFGDIVLSSFCPSILIVSTPNYEYNPILQRSALSAQEEDGDEKNHSLPCKFRNHDHKFEWTREQFSQWASNLASRHNYSVEFSGVGGSGDSEPGFASQIVVFRKDQVIQDTNGQCPRTGHDEAHHYETIWEWSSSNMSRSTL